MILGELKMNFPSTTIVHKRIPKKTLYEQAEINSATKNLFSEQIDSIFWEHKISKDTANVEMGQKIKEIVIIKIILSAPQIDTSILKIINKAIPYPILFLLNYQDTFKVSMFHTSSIDNSVRYYDTEWKSENELDISICGINMDTVYENFVLQIIGISKDFSMSLDEQLYKIEQAQKLEKEITRLERQARNEKQPKKKFELVQMIRKLKAGQEN